MSRTKVAVLANCLENVLSKTCSQSQPTRHLIPHLVAPHQCKHATLPLDLVGAGGDLFGFALAVPVDVQQASGADLVDGIALVATAARRLGALLGVVVPDGWSGGRVI